MTLGSKENYINAAATKHEARFHRLDYWRGVTPTFYKNKKNCANRNAYKNAYQIIVLMKNFPKINLV
jgi:hypothetical protein